MTTLVAVEIKIQFVCKKLWYKQENMSSKSLRLAKGENEFFPPKIHATNYNQNFLLRFGKKTTLKLYILRRLKHEYAIPHQLSSVDYCTVAWVGPFFKAHLDHHHSGS